jgi:glycosyltransferase involved in cell wall biosynthesis
MTRPNRVLVTAESTAYGGVERRLLEEIGVLRSLGFKVDLAPRSFVGSDRWLAEARSAGANVLNWPVYKFIERGHWMFPLPQSASLSRLALRGGHYAFAHVAMPWTTAGLSRMVALKRAGVPVVLGLHIEYGVARIHARLRGLADEALSAVVAGYGVSRVVVASFRRAYPDLKVGPDLQVIWNGVDHQRFQPDAAARQTLRSHWGWTDEVRVVAVCGRLEAGKNVPLVINALGVALQRQPNLRLLVIGDGPQRGELERMARPLADRVRFTGHVDDVPRHLAAADVYASASLREGFPLAAGEALATGLPMVTTDVPVNREAFAACPSVHLVAGENPAEWASALQQAVLPGAGLGSRDFVMQGLTASRMRERLRAFYASLPQAALVSHS